MTAPDSTLASSLFPAVAVAALAGLWLLNFVRPGWSGPAGVALRPVLVAVWGALAVLCAVAVGLALDPLARRGLVFGVLLHGPPVVAPLGRWFWGPDLPRDLVLLVALVLSVLADRWRLLARRPPPAGQLRAGAARAARAALAIGLPVLLLLLAWIDVLASLLGQHVAGAYRGLEVAGGMRWHPWAQLVAPPDPRLMALYWWLAASLLALGGRRSLARYRYGWAWAAVPLGGALLALLGRPLALLLALPAYAVVAMGAALLARERRAAGAVAERATLVALLGLALGLRWAPGMLRPPASDAEGYFNVGRVFWERVAEAGTNPIALSYLNMHPASREPLFPLLAQVMFGLFGTDLVYQRYLTVGLAVAGVYLTHRFGRACFGPAVGLLSALVVAVLPWQVVVSQEGLREELGLACVYGLAVLVVTRPWPLSTRDGEQGDAPRRLSWPAAAAGGALAAGAVLTRLDAGAVVGVLLVAWALRLRGAWRDTLPAWIVSGALVAPMLVGYVLRAGDPLTPLRGSMGGDIQAAMTPLMRGELPPSYVLWATGVGMREVYAGTIFGSAATLLPGAVQPLAVVVALAALAGGTVALVWRGPRLPALLAFLGVYLPPFTYLAGTSVLHGPGGGYTDRYTYLVLPAVLAVSFWAVLSAGRRLAAFRWSGLRSPLPAGAIALQGPPKARAKS